jgi:ATP-binding cassette subfamily B protein
MLIIARKLFSILPTFVNVYMSARIINGISEKLTYDHLLFLAIITIASNLIIAIVSALLSRIINVYQAEFDSRYDMRINQKVMSLDYADVENPQTHIQKQKIYEQRNMNGGGIWQLFDAFPDLIQNIFTIIFSVALIFSLFRSSSPLSTIFLISGVMLNIIISMLSTSSQTKKMYEIMNDILPFNRTFSYYITKYISGYHAGKDIRIYSQSELIKSESMELFDDVYKTFNKLSRNQIKYTMLVSLTTTILSTAIYLFIGIKALSGTFGVGYIVQYISGISSFTSGFTGVMTKITELRSNNEALKTYFDFMEIPTHINSGDIIPNSEIGDNAYEIEFRNVLFKYPGAESYVLSGMNLKIHSGRKIAIVGVNGCGKTTMIKLLCRLYNPTDGVITLNGVDIRNYDYDEYIKIFSVVFQDFKLFAFELG